MKLSNDYSQNKTVTYYTNIYYKYTYGSFNIDNEIYYYFGKNNNFGAQKPKLIPKIKCTTLLEQLYYMYCNTRPKSASKGVTKVCFHPFSTYTFSSFDESKAKFKSVNIVFLSWMKAHDTSIVGESIPCIFACLKNLFFFLLKVL
jgi:hypothetical protein